MIAIPQPRLWTPRLGPWWRLPRFDSLLMAHLKKGAGGHLLKNAAGHLVKDCGTDPCGFCDTGTTSASIPVLVENVAICTASCAVNDQFSGSSATIVADVNGSYDVPQTITPCFYELQIGTVDYYSGNETCSGSPTHTEPIYLTVEFKTSGVQVSIQSNATFGGGYSMAAIFFNALDSDSSPYDCSQQRTIADSQYVCLSGTSAVALGGTVTLFP